MKWMDRINTFARNRWDKNLLLLIKNSSWLAFGGLGSSCFQFIQSLIVARSLGVENFGILALIITYVSMLDQLVDFRIRETVIKYVSGFDSRGEKTMAQATIKLCYSLDAITGIVAFALVITTSSLVANYLVHQPDVYLIINLYALSLLISTVNGTSSALLQVYNKFSWLSIQGISLAGSRLGIVIAVLSVNPTVKGVVWAFILSELIGGISINLLALKVLRKEKFNDWKGAKISLLKGRLKEIRNFLLTTNLHTFLGTFTKNMDIMFLGYFRGPTETGYYKIAKSFAQLLTYIFDPICKAIYPELARIWSKGNKEDFLKLVKQTTMFLAGILFPICALLMVIIPRVISNFVGTDYLPAANAARILLIGLLFAGIFAWLRPAFLSIGRADIPMFYNIGVVFCQVILSILLVPMFGYIGSSMVQSFLYVFAYTLLLLHFLKLINYKSSA